MKKSAIGLLAVLVLLAGVVGMSLVRSTAASAAAKPAATPSVSANAQDTDQVEEQVGDQNEADDQSEAAEPAKADEAGPDETTDQSEPGIVGSVAVPDPEPSDLSGLAKITAAKAEALALAANAGTTVVKTELDNENGYLVYSVELASGTGVKVDAGDGTILASQDAGPQDEQGGAGDENSEAQDTETDSENGD